MEKMFLLKTLKNIAMRTYTEEQLVKAIDFGAIQMKKYGWVAMTEQHEFIESLPPAAPAVSDGIDNILAKIEQYSDPGSPEYAITQMKQLASEARKQYAQQYQTKG